MLSSLRKFSETLTAKIFIALIALSFVFWGINDFYKSSYNNAIAEINGDEISFNEFTKEYSKIIRNNNIQSQKLAIEKFKMVEKDYSYTEWAPKSLLMMAYVYYEANRCVDTLSVLERYVKFYPNNPERVYVEYLKGVCYFEEVSEFSKDQEKTVKAITQFKSLINSYPNTEYADDAKYKLDLLNDLMAGKEMYVARYYMNKQKWAAAINRLKIIVDKYQTTIYIEEALYRLVEIYHKLGLEEDASKAAAILGYNFNSSEWYKKSYFREIGNDS